MISLDTNLLVRLVTNDDKAKARFVAGLVENNPVFISKTVLLETEWVLRFSYDLNRENILGILEKLLGIAQLTVEDPFCVSQAFHWYKYGMDFADALHLASSGRAKKFATFDKKLINKAKKLDIKISFLTIP